MLTTGLINGSRRLAAFTLFAAGFFSSAAGLLSLTATVLEGLEFTGTATCFTVRFASALGCRAGTATAFAGTAVNGLALVATGTTFVELVAGFAGTATGTAAL